MLGAVAAGATLGSLVGPSGSSAGTGPVAAATPRVGSHTAVSPLVLRLAQRRLGLPRVASPVGARTLRPAADCPGSELPGLECSTVVVPLDRSGGTPGTIGLHVETLPAPEPRRGVMFLIAGGPGQGSAGSFDLGSPIAVAYYRFLFPGYTLVAFDNRGTGDSNYLDCPGIDGSYEPEAEPALVAGCAAAIGPSRVFYGTDEHVEDLEAVRAALGADQVALWGTSYGTKLATAYALAHPTRVERLLLDSVLPPDENDPFRTKSAKAIPAAIASLCAGGACSRITRDAVRDLAQLGDRLAVRPVSGKVTRANGRTKLVKLRGVELLSLAVEADLSPGIAVVLPAAVKAALAGTPQPLLRLYDLAAAEPSGRSLSAGLFAATVCTDGPFPWGQDSEPATRRAAVDAAVRGLPAGAFGPFGRWAARIGNAEFCIGWPAPSGIPWIAPGPLPDVPVLAVNGGFDMRTPVPGAQEVVSRFPQGRLIVVPGVGHSVLGADPSFCAARAVRQWMLGQSFSDECGRPNPYVQPVPAYPAPLGKLRAGPARTFAIAAETVFEAEAMWLLTQGEPATVAGVAGGKVAIDADGFRLDRYSTTRGVAVSGRVALTDVGPPLAFEGVVTVSGRSSATGLLGLADGKLAGTLGGVLVGSSEPVT